MRIAQHLVLFKGQPFEGADWIYTNKQRLHISKPLFVCGGIAKLSGGMMKTNIYKYNGPAPGHS